MHVAFTSPATASDSHATRFGVLKLRPLYSRHGWARGFYSQEEQVPAAVTLQHCAKYCPRLTKPALTLRACVFGRTVVGTSFWVVQEIFICVYITFSLFF